LITSAEMSAYQMYGWRNSYAWKSTDAVFILTLSKTRG
jgi:hypothetical protein